MHCWLRRRFFDLVSRPSISYIRILMENAYQPVLGACRASLSSPPIPCALEGLHAKTSSASLYLIQWRWWQYVWHRVVRVETTFCNVCRHVMAVVILVLQDTNIQRQQIHHTYCWYSVPISQSIPDAVEVVAALSAVLLLANLEGLLHLASTPDMLLPNLACAEVPTLLDVPGRLSSAASCVEMLSPLLLVVLSLLSQKLLAVLRVLPLGVLVGVMGRPVRRAACCNFCCSRYSSLQPTKHCSGILAAS